MDQQPKGQVSSLLEHSWFFGNTLKNKPISAKIMVRSNSDPCPSSTTKEVMTMVSPDHDPIKTNNLRRAPSLPVTLEKNTKYDLVEEDDEDEPRMGDLIMEAMPMPVSKPSRRLDRMSSLPPCRVANEASSNAPTLKNVEKSCKKVSVESSPPLLQEKGPIAMVKLTRRASIDSSLLPPKYTSKGTKQTSSNSKNRTPKKQDATSNMNIPNNSNHKIKSQKSLINVVQVDELQGFKDLGFSFDNNDIGPNVKQVRPTLQRGASLDSKTLRRSHLSQPPSVLKWNDPKTSSNQDDMKAQIKFWARAVASNVRQEC